MKCLQLRGAQPWFGRTDQLLGVVECQPFWREREQETGDGQGGAGSSHTVLNIGISNSQIRRNTNTETSTKPKEAQGNNKPTHPEDRGDPIIEGGGPRVQTHREID